MKIRYHHPMLYSDTFAGYDKICRSALDKIAGPGMKIDHTWSKRGTQAVQYTSCQLLNTLETVQHIIDAEQKGYDGVLIGCSLDIGLKEGREVSRIPVVSSIEAAMYTSCMMGRKFCIVSFGERAKIRQEQLIDEYGLRQRATKVRSFEMSLEELGNALTSPERTKGLRNVFMQEAKRAIVEEGAEVIIPGCGILAALCVMENIVKVDGMEEVPVIDTFGPGLKMLEMLVLMKKELGINISRRGLYQSPPLDLIIQVKNM